jgi:hypothetical protein
MTAALQPCIKAPRRVASPWDALLDGPPIRLQQRVEDPTTSARAGTKLSHLLAELASARSANTLTLAVCCDLTPRQVWGLLKARRAAGQVRFEDGRWSMVESFPAGPQALAIERAAQLLRMNGWEVSPPPPADAGAS